MCGSGALTICAQNAKDKNGMNKIKKSFRCRRRRGRCRRRHSAIALVSGNTCGRRSCESATLLDAWHFSSGFSFFLFYFIICAQNIYKTKVLVQFVLSETIKRDLFRFYSVSAARRQNGNKNKNGGTHYRCLCRVCGYATITVAFGVRRRDQFFKSELNVPIFSSAKFSSLAFCETGYPLHVRYTDDAIDD